MKKYARTSHGVSPEVFSIDRPFSNFDFIDRKFQGLPTLRRIMSQIRKHSGRTMVFEIIEEAEDIREENEDIQRRYALFNSTQTYRLSFFRKKISSISEISTCNDEDFIGYAIIKSDTISEDIRCTRIYESVIRPTLSDNHFIKGKQLWTCSVANNPLRVKGYLYAQQNNMTNVCAHVALRSAAARYHKNGDMSYREMNQLVGIDHLTKKAGGDDGEGLSNQEMVNILEAAGARCFVGDYTRSSIPVPFQKYLYGSIESGYPAIVFFGIAGRPRCYHAIPLFGHSFDEDTWVPKADLSYFNVGPGTKYIPSESWVSTYIAHDDNWGSNFCIPRRYLYTQRICDKLWSSPDVCPMENECVAYVIGTVPRSVKLSPIRAEVIGAEFLFTILPQLPTFTNTWKDRLIQYARQNQLVLRPILIRASDYCSHLEKIRDWNGHVIQKELIEGIKTYMPDEFVWMVELSVPELFSTNRRKVGEVLLRAEFEPDGNRDFNSFILARLPECFSLYKEGQGANPQYLFIRSGIQNHVELYGCEEST